MFFDSLLPPPKHLRARQSRVPVNLSSNSQDKNDLIADQLYNQIIERIKSDEIDSEVNIRSRKIISNVVSYNIHDKQEILEKLRNKLNEYFNKITSKINVTPDESIKKLLEDGIEARINIFKNFEKTINQTRNSSILPEVKKVAEVKIISIEPRDSYFEDFENALKNYIKPRLCTQNNLPKNEFEDYKTKENKIKAELLEMNTSQNPKDKNFFKNYLLKHLELIKLYEDAKEVMIKKFKEAGKDLKSVDSEFNQLKDEARKDCLDFLLANSQDLPKNQANETLNSDLHVEQHPIRPSDPVAKTLENDLHEEQHPIRPSDPVAKTLESESCRGNRVRTHSGHSTLGRKAR